MGMSAIPPEYLDANLGDGFTPEANLHQHEPDEDEEEEEEENDDREDNGEDDNESDGYSV